MLYRRGEMDTVESILALLVPEGDCLVWPRYRDRSGYGRVTYDHKRRFVHRIAYEYAYGPTDLCVLHSCDNPPCSNPEHLFEGTHATNMVDRNAKGRQAYGVRHGRSSLRPEQIRAIRTSGDSTRKAASRFGVSQPQISKIRRGRVWGQVR